MRNLTVARPWPQCWFCTGMAQAETALERGEYLVRGPMGCGNCHTPMGPQGEVEGQELAGRLVEENEAFTAIAPNITPAGAVGQWSDAELAKAIREGIGRMARIIGPPMPFTIYRTCRTPISPPSSRSCAPFRRSRTIREVGLQHPAAAGLWPAGRASPTSRAG